MFPAPKSSSLPSCALLAEVRAGRCEKVPGERGRKGQSSPGGRPRGLARGRSPRAVWLCVCSGGSSPRKLGAPMPHPGEHPLLLTIVTLSQVHLLAAEQHVAWCRLLQKGTQTLQPQTEALSRSARPYPLPLGLSWPWPCFSHLAAFKVAPGPLAWLGWVTGEHGIQGGVCDTESVSGKGHLRST